jgi:hypothetical protein
MNKNQKWKTRTTNEKQEPKVKIRNKEWIGKHQELKNW